MVKPTNPFATSATTGASSAPTQQSRLSSPLRANDTELTSASASRVAASGTAARFGTQEQARQSDQLSLLSLFSHHNFVHHVAEQPPSSRYGPSAHNGQHHRYQQQHRSDDNRYAGADEIERSIMNVPFLGNTPFEHENYQSAMSNNTHDLVDIIDNVLMVLSEPMGIANDHVDNNDNVFSIDGHEGSQDEHHAHQRQNNHEQAALNTIGGTSTNVPMQDDDGNSNGDGEHPQSMAQAGNASHRDAPMDTDLPRYHLSPLIQPPLNGPSSYQYSQAVVNHSRTRSLAFSVTRPARRQQQPNVGWDMHPAEVASNQPQEYDVTSQSNDGHTHTSSASPRQ